MPVKIINELGSLNELPELPPLEPKIAQEESKAITDAPRPAAATIPTPPHTETAHCKVCAAQSQTQTSSSGAFVWPGLDQLNQLDMGLKEFMDSIEERLVQEALARAGGVKNQAAELLSIKRTTLIEKLKKMGE
jgi:DNA-binding NtrC family response regulator